MGQAKLRGTKAERVAEGVRKREEMDAQREAYRAARWKQMTQTERRTQISLAALLALMQDKTP